MNQRSNLRKSAFMETTEIQFSRLISRLPEYKASDLHFSAGNVPIFRVDGKLKPLSEENVLTAKFIEEVIFSLLNEEEKEILKKEKEIVITRTLERRFRFKINIFYQKNFLSCSFRFIPSAIKDLRELRLPKVVEEFAKLKKGLVIITGPFNSGKTTTLASLINEINKNQSRYILTLEKPIEYLFSNLKSIIEQREVSKDVLDFKKGLRGIIHKDVDVAVVSEIDSSETMEAVLEVAESGKLIFAVFTSDTVLKTLEKILSFFPLDKQAMIRLMLASNLEAILCQRLLPRLGGSLVLVSEILITTPPVRSLIRDNRFPQINSLIQTSQREGMISLDKSLANLVKTGEILIDDALANAVDVENLKAMLK